MTPQQLQKLQSLTYDSDFIPFLRENRPEITDEEYLVAKGWEKCIDFIIMTAETKQETPPTVGQGYVPIERL